MGNNTICIEISVLHFSKGNQNVTLPIIHPFNVILPCPAPASSTKTYIHPLHVTLPYLAPSNTTYQPPPQCYFSLPCPLQHNLSSSGKPLNITFPWPEPFTLQWHLSSSFSILLFLMPETFLLFKNHHPDLPYPEISPTSIVQLEAVAFHHFAHVRLPSNGHTIVFCTAVFWYYTRFARSWKK